MQVQKALKGKWLFSIEWQLLILLLLASLSFLIVVVVWYKSAHQSSLNSPAAERLLESRKLIEELVPPSLGLVQPALLLRKMLYTADKDNLEALSVQFNELNHAFTQRTEYWKAHVPFDDPYIFNDLKRLITLGEKFFGKMSKDYIHALRENKPDEATLHLRQLDNLFAQYATELDALVAKLEIMQKNAQEKTRQTIQDNEIITLTITLVIIFMVFGIGATLAYIWSNRISLLLECIDQLGKGAVDVDIPFLRSKGESGEFARALESWRILQEERTKESGELKATAEALRTSQQMAENAARAKSDFLANMSHEIRTPMNGVIGFAHLMQRTELTEQQRDYLLKILASAEHQLGIVNEILDFSKIEAGKLELESIPVSVSNLLDLVYSLMSALCEKKGIQLHVHRADDVPDIIRADPLRLKQILINLTSNAVKFTAQGGIKIEVTVTSREGAMLHLLFSVEDSGCGMTEVQQARLFKAFSQADSSTTRQYGGSGLGLSISKALVEMMGGEIGVRSQAGKGSTFYFSLPTQELDAAEFKAELEKTSANPPDLSNLKLAGNRILLVDDNDINCQIGTGLLSVIGVQVEIAENGQIAVDKALANDYDMILMDMQMPVMDGVTAARTLRQQGKTLPILALTANAIASELAKCLAVGMNDTITKPIDPADLYTKILRWMPQKEGAAAAATMTPQLPQEQIDLPLPHIAGLEAQQGLLRVMGNKLSYRGILRRFTESEADAVHRVRNYMSAVDRSAAQRAAHTLKGIAGTIGATKVQELAKELEYAIRDERDEHLAAIEGKLSTELDILIHQLQEYLNATEATVQAAEETAAKAVVDVPIEVVKEKATQLLHMLEEQDGEALEFFTDNKAQLTRWLGKESITQVDIALQAFNFSQAQAELSAALKTAEAG